MFGPASSPLRREESALHGHRFLLRAGLLLGNVFGWIFIFEYFLFISGAVSRALVGTLLAYGLAQLITIFATPLAAANLRRGVRPLLMWAVVALGSSFVLLGATLTGFFHDPMWGIALFAILIGLYRALYFAPYELSRAEADKAVLRGRMYWEVLLALFPAFVGATFIMEPYAPVRIVYGAAALVGISLLFLPLLPETRERFSYSFLETYRELFTSRNRRLFWLSFLEGVQGAALFLIWPLAIFLILGFSYTILGIVLSITLLCVLLGRALIRRYIPSLPNLSMPMHVILAVSGWIGRLAAGNPIAIVVADAYAYTTRHDRGTAIDPFTFEQAADNASFIDEYTVLKEIAMGLGRIALVAITGMFFISLPLVAGFAAALLFAGGAAGASIVIARHKHTSLI